MSPVGTSPRMGAYNASVRAREYYGVARNRACTLRPLASITSGVSARRFAANASLNVALVLSVSPAIVASTPIPSPGKVPRNRAVWAASIEPCQKGGNQNCEAVSFPLGEGLHMTPKTAPDMDISVRISATHHEPSRGQL